MKKKEHLYRPSDLAKSVLRGGEARAICGFKKAFTREDMESKDYLGICGDCFSVADKQQPGESISTLKKAGWLALLEKAFIDVTEPVWQMQTYTWTSATNTTANGFPPAA